MNARPLAGRRVAVLRASGEHDGIRGALEQCGAEAVTAIVAEVLDRSDAEVRHDVGDLARFEWVAVSSQHAARRLALWAHTWPGSVRVGAVGPATAAAVERLGVRVALVADAGTARSLAARLDEGPILFLAASSARDDLARDLSARGIVVVTVVAYDLAPRALAGADAEALASSDAIVAMSPAAIDALAALPVASRDAALQVPVVAIGPTTAEHAAVIGWPIRVVAGARDATAVCEAVRVLLER